MNVKQLKSILNTIEDDVEIFIFDEDDEYTDVLKSVEIGANKDNNNKLFIILNF